MSNKENIIIFREILVAVDPSSHSQAALEAAAYLAEKTEGKIHGLFVQEESWHKVSKLPSITTINELTGSTSALEEQYLSQQIEMLKRRLRRQVKTISRQKKIAHTWKAVEGCVEEEILQAAENADLITLGRRGSSFPQKKKIGSSTEKIIQDADKPVLILKKGLKLRGNITAVYDASKTSHRSIRLALSLAEKFDVSLTVLVMRNTPETARDRDTELEKMVDTAPVKVELLLLKNPDVWGFIHSMNRRDTGLLIMPKNQPLLQTAMEEILYQLKCPLLMMN